jgi:hypothetical protein
MKKKGKKGKSYFKPKVVVYSLIGIAGLVLTYTVHWMFISVTAIMILLNQRELMKK